MTFLKNKHVVAAMIIAPILAVIAFIATDKMVSERPHVAKEGQAYELVPRPNCRYTSGVCTLKNGNFMLDVEFELTEQRINIKGSHPLQGIKVGFDNQSPVELEPRDTSQLFWSGFIGESVQRDTFQLVAQASGALYFAENTMNFKERKTLTD